MSTTLLEGGGKSDWVGGILDARDNGVQKQVPTTAARSCGLPHSGRLMRMDEKSKNGPGLLPYGAVACAGRYLRVGCLCKAGREGRLGGSG